MSNHIFIRPEGSIAFGAEAERLFVTCHEQIGFKLSDMKPGAKYDIKNYMKNSVSIRFEEAVALILKQIMKCVRAMFQVFRILNISHCVIAVSTLADYSYR